MHFASSRSSLRHFIYCSCVGNTFTAAGVCIPRCFPQLHASRVTVKIKKSKCIRFARKAAGMRASMPAGKTLGYQLLMQILTPHNCTNIQKPARSVQSCRSWNCASAKRSVLYSPISSRTFMLAPKILREARKCAATLWDCPWLSKPFIWHFLKSFHASGFAAVEGNFFFKLKVFC
mgnify:CR=1 FL=1